MRLSSPKLLALALLVALVLRLAVAWHWQQRLDGQFGFGDSKSYWDLGRAVATGEPYEYGAGTAIFRTPGYPILLAPIFLMEGSEPSVFWGRVLSVLFGTISVAGVWWWAKRLFGPTAGRIAAGLAAIYPGAIATSALVLTEAPFAPWMILHLLLWTAAWQSESRKRSGWLALGGGMAAGVATLIRPSWLLFIPFAVALGLVFGKPRTRHLTLGLAMLAGLVLVMAPWWVRNYRVCGHFVATSLQTGASLYDGQGPQANGASDMQFVSSITADEHNDPAGAGGSPDDTFEYRLNCRMQAEAVAAMRQDPGRALGLAPIKLLRIWNVWPNEASLSNWVIRLGVAGAYVPVMLLAIVGVWRTTRRGWPYVLCWLPAVYFSLLHMVFVGSIRYRQPAMLGLIVLAAGVIAWRTTQAEKMQLNDKHKLEPERE